MKKFMTQWAMLCALMGLCATAQAATLAEAIDMPGATITTSGYGWEVTTDRAQTGGYCARSKNYQVASSTASMTLTVTRPGRISFRWMSSGEGHGYDYLWYCVDGGSELRRIQGDHGDSSWETVTYDISGAGTHTITWTYRKDGSYNYGSDRGYVDCVSWTPKDVQTYYVNRATGSDSNNGLSLTSAKATIQSAINAASAGDRIVVAEGTYAPINVNKQLEIQGAGSDKTIIDGGNSSRCATFSGTDGYVLRNVKLQNGYSGYENGGGAYYGTLEDCVISNCKTVSYSSSYYYGGGSYCSILSRCKITGCQAYYGGGIYSGHAKNCLFEGNKARYGAGAYEGQLRNCTLTENSADYYGGAMLNGSAYNCISYDNSAGYGSYYANFYNTSTYGCTTENPHFLDAANSDYRLAADSPCIDAGNNSYVEGDLDLAGHTRIYNGRVDIGCYERGSYTVAFDANGGTTDGTPRALDPGSELGSLPACTWAGHKFLGWFTHPTGGDAVSEATTVSSDMTLYAHWADCLSEVVGGQNWYYSVDANGWATIEAGEYSGSLTVPAKLGGHTVLYIGEGAFANCTGLTVIKLPAGLKSIRERAFDGCSALGYVKIPAGVAWIGAYAFRNCASMTSAYVPAKVATLGVGAYMGCTSLASVTLTGPLTAIASDCFNGCRSLANVTIPPTVTAVNARAFKDCVSFTAVTVPDTVTYLSPTAFEGCVNVTSVTYRGELGTLAALFPDCLSRLTLAKVSPGTRTLKAGAFDGCASLTGVKLQAGLTAIGAYAFRGCTGLVRVTIPATVTSIGDGAFEGCTHLDGEIIPATVKSLGKGVFRNCTGMKTVTIAAGRTSIPEATFAGCTRLTKAVLPDTVTSIGVSAFDGCSALTYEKIPAGVTWIGAYAFRNCASMTSAYVPAKVATLGVGAYMGCTSLASVTLTGPLTSIASDCFNGCRSLANVTIPPKVTAVNARAFKDCLAFTAVTVPEGVKSISANAFANMTSLRHVELPKSLTSLAAGAFSGCQFVRSVTFPASRVTLSAVFPDGFSQIERVVVPTGIASLKADAFAGCSSLTEVSLPSTVTSVGARAFDGCSALEELRLPSGITWMGTYVFRNCSRLSQLTYPVLVRSVPDGTFYGCSSYSAFDFGTCPYSIGAEAFAGCPFDELRIPEGVVKVQDRAFAGCSSLLRVSLPCGLQTFGEGVFADCGNIRFVTTSPAYGTMRAQFPSSYGYVLNVSLLPDGTAPTSSFFYDCASIMTLYLHDVTESLAALLGDVCARLTTVEIAEGLTVLPDNFFIGCLALEDLVLPSTLESLGSYDVESSGFAEMLSRRPDGPWYAGSWLLTYKGRKPETYTVRDGTVGIGAYAFSEKDEEESTYLRQVNLPASLRYIGQRAFYQCTSLDNVIIPDLVEVIDIGAFQQCTYMQNLRLGSGLKHIGDLAFADTVILHAEMKDGLVSIGRQVFYNCGSLLSVELPSTLEEFGDDVFSGCPRITGAVVPTHLMTISNMFPNYGQLSEVSIAAGETRICDGMFSGAGGIQSIMIPGTIVEVGERAFNSCSSLQSVSLPDSVERIGEAAFAGCSSLKQVRLPGHITSLPDKLFVNCSMLKSFIVPASVVDMGDNIVGTDRWYYSGSVTEIYFLGNAPTTHGGVYDGSNGSLTSYVIDGTKGWDGIRTSTRLPETWNGRAITRWTANQFDVTFNANGGLFAEKAPTYACEQITDNAYSLPPNNPTWAGHTFEGWFTTETAGTRVTADTLVTATRPHELFAHWSVGAKITVTFNATGGTNPGGWNTHTYTADSTYGTLPTPTREGYAFDGWYTAKSGGTRIISSSATPSINTELYAHWTIGSYSIRFNANGGVGSPYSQYCTWGDGMTLVPNRFSRNGYVFAGWATTKTGIARFAECAYVDDYSTMVNETVDLYAVWARETYSVRFDSNGGTGTMPSQSFVYGDAQYLTANAFARPGYVFEGWSRTTTGGVLYRDREMVSRLTDAGGTVTLFAVWGRSYWEIRAMPVVASVSPSAASMDSLNEGIVQGYLSGALASGDGFYELIVEADGDGGFIRIAYADGEVVTGEVEIIDEDGVLSVMFEDGAVMELDGEMLF